MSNDLYAIAIIALEMLGIFSLGALKERSTNCFLETLNSSAGGGNAIGEIVSYSRCVLAIRKVHLCLSSPEISLLAALQAAAVSEALSAVLLKAVNRDPLIRFSSASDFLGVLRKVNSQTPAFVRFLGK